MQLIRGQKVKLSDVWSHLQFLINVKLNSPFVTDVALFALDNQNKLVSDDYMIFYNQPVSPCQAVRLTQNTPNFCQFSLDLARLPNSVQKMVITLAIDGDGMMRNLGDSQILLANSQNQTVANFALSGAMFANERAVMALEVYKKDGIWRMGAIGQGFEGGLPALVAYFGATVAQEGLPVSTPTPHTSVQYVPPQTSSLDLKKKLSLEKAQKTGNASIIDLTKKSLITLEKKGLLDVKARVALVLDASGSMNWQYKNGDVQKIVNRLMPLAINFDDDGSFECWAFADLTTQLDDVTLDNINDFVNTSQQGWQNWRVGTRINNELSAICAVMDYYVPNNGHTSAVSALVNQTSSWLGKFFSASSVPTTPTTPKGIPNTTSALPVYVLFISDGGVGSGRQMEEILTRCANLPIFWQFVGVGGTNYGILERLDEMTGRVVDNCNFFAVDNIGSINDNELYDKLLGEFPMWLKEAKNKGIIG